MKILSPESASVDVVKDDISSNVGRDIELKEYNRQGRLLHTYVGTIKQIFDSVFLVECRAHGYKINKSFSYVDVAIGEFTYELK